MGAIETMLGIVELRNATGLSLALGEVPSLLPVGEGSALTMPPLSAVMLDHLLDELFTSAQRTALFTDGALVSAYASPRHGPFAIRAATQGDKITLTLTRDTPAAVAPDAPPAASFAAAAPPSPPVAAPAVRAEPKRSTPALPSLDAAAPGAAEIPREVSALFNSALEQAVRRGASDVLVTVDVRPLLRVDGELIECNNVATATQRSIEQYFQPRIGAERMATFETTGSVDFAFELARASGGGPARFRANLFRHGSGLAVAIRPIPSELPTLAELHLPSTLTQLVEQRHGLVLVTGATGSGKSTTTAALLEHVNATRAAHIVTLEDPIEYAYPRRRAVVHQREIGRHVDSFASGLRAALRENPDVLLVGEMRDAETIRLALTAAHTGHLVLATLHSGTAVMAIERVIDGFSDREQAHVRQELASTLRHVIAQRLLPASDGGRVPALEILAINNAVAAQIRDGRTHMIASQLETGADDGMVPMARAIATLVRSGRVTRAEAVAACDDRAALEQLLDGRSAARSAR